MAADPVLVILALCGLAAGVVGGAWYAGNSVRAVLAPLAVFVPMWAVLGVAAGTVGTFGGLAVMVPAAGAVCGVVTDQLLSRRLEKRRRLVIGGVFSLVVVFPVAVLVFGMGTNWAYAVLGVLDFAGALPFAVTVGCVALVLVRRRPARIPRRPRAVWGALALVLAAVALTVGLELRIDEVSAHIAWCVVLVSGCALAGAALVEFLRTGRTSAEASSAGLLTGVAAGLAIAPWVELGAAAAVGVVAGVVQALAFRRGVGGSVAAPLLSGGLVGLLSLGLFAIGPGFVYSGQPTQLGAQALACGAVMVFALAVAGVLVGLTRRMRT